MPRLGFWVPKLGCFLCSPARMTTILGSQRWVQAWPAQELGLHCNVWPFPVLRLGRLPSIKSAEEPSPVLF